MKGTRPLDNDEIRSVSTCFTGTFKIRNSGLFMLGVSTGGCISELLSLTIGDVFQNGKAVSDLFFEKSVVRGNRFLAPEEIPPGRVHPSAISVATQLRHCPHASSNRTRHPQKSVYRSGVERQTGDT